MKSIAARIVGACLRSACTTSQRSVRAADGATFVHGMARALIVSVLLLVAGAVMAWRNLGQAGARGIRARGASPQRQ
ncbi:hypothetical protein BCEP27_31042 [Burkholderia cepacia]